MHMIIVDGRKIMKGGGGGTSIIFGACIAVCIALIAGGAVAVGYRSVRPDQSFVLPSVAGLCAALITGMIALQLFRKLL